MQAITLFFIPESQNTTTAMLRMNASRAIQE
jgi:hypothetical protein